jgi:hypothetical protein
LQTVRETFGGALLLVIEVLVAADLIPDGRGRTHPGQRRRPRDDRADPDVS